MKRIEAKKLAKQLFDLSIKICLMVRHGRPNMESIQSMRVVLDRLENMIEVKQLPPSAITTTSTRPKP